MIEPTGYTALDLIGFTDKGDYDPSANYVKNDLVHDDNGSIWRVLIDDTSGVTPAEGLNYTIFIRNQADAAKRIIAPVETSPTANAHAAGTQIIYHNVLYDVTTAIAAGGALVVYPTSGYNIKPAPLVTSQIQALSNNQGTLTSQMESGIAPIQTTLTAKQNYSKGDRFFYNGSFYEATAAISSGNTITIGSNGNAKASINLSNDLEAFKSISNITITKLSNKVNEMKLVAIKTGHILMLNGYFTVNSQTSTWENLFQIMGIDVVTTSNTGFGIDDGSVFSIGTTNNSSNPAITSSKNFVPNKYYTIFLYLITKN